MSNLISLPAFALSVASSWAQRPVCLGNHGGWDGPIFNKDHVHCAHLNKLALFQDLRDSFCPNLTTGSGAFSAHIEPDLWDDGACVFSFVDTQPNVLKAKASQNAADNSSYSQAIHSPYADKWWDAMETELNTLEVDLKAQN